MSADGVGPFGNDLAADFCDDFRSMEPAEAGEAIQAAFRNAASVPAGQYLDRDMAEPAIAAAALLLAKRRGDSEVLADNEVEHVVPDLPDNVLLPLLVAALDRTMEPDSEVFRLWDAVRLGEEWSAVVKGLRAQAEPG